MSSAVVPRLTGYAAMMVAKVGLAGKMKATQSSLTPHTPTTVSSDGGMRATVRPHLVFGPNGVCDRDVRSE